MNFWCTAESASDVSPLYFSNRERVGAMKLLESTLNQYLKSIDLGEWHQWRVIFMIVSQNQIRDLKFHETRRLTRKDRTLDFRVFVDHERSKDAEFSECIDLLIPALERTLPYFKKAGITQEMQEKIRDCVRLAAEEVKASKSAKH